MFLFPGYVTSSRVSTHRAQVTSHKVTVQYTQHSLALGVLAWVLTSNGLTARAASFPSVLQHECVLRPRSWFLFCGLAYFPLRIGLGTLIKGSRHISDTTEVLVLVLDLVPCSDLSCCQDWPGDSHQRVPSHLRQHAPQSSRDVSAPPSPSHSTGNVFLCSSVRCTRLCWEPSPASSWAPH